MAPALSLTGSTSLWRRAGDSNSNRGATPASRVSTARPTSEHHPPGQECSAGKTRLQAPLNIALDSAAMRERLRGRASPRGLSNR